MPLLEEGSLLHLFGQQYYGVHAPNAGKGTEMFWLVGVLVTLFGATLTVVGFIVQKTSHSAASQTSDSFGRSGTPARPYYMEKRWLIGGAIWILGNIVCWVALGLAPQSILAAINCWNIVICLVIAPWFLGEPVTQRTAMSAGLLAVGTAWVVACGPKAYQQHTVVLIVEALKKPQSICAFAMSAGFLLIMSVLAYRRGDSRPGYSTTPRTLSYLQFTAISATFAWYATLLSKSTAKIMVASVQLHQSLYLNPAFLLLAAAFPLCAAAQVHFLNMGLKYGDAVMVIPIYEALSMTGQIVVGGIVFDEFAGLGPAQHAWFWPGVAIVVVGITMLAMEVKSPPTPIEDKIDERVPLMSSCLGSTKDVDHSGY